MSASRPAFYSTMRVLMLGHRERGKSELAGRLTGNPGLKAEQRCRQVWSLGYVEHTCGVPCELLLWELAPLDDVELHHTLWIDGADLILIVIDVTDRQRAADEARFWLQQCRSGSMAPILVVGNRGQETDREALWPDMEELKSKYLVTEVCFIEREKDTGIRLLDQKIRELAAQIDVLPPVGEDTFQAVRACIGMQKALPLTDLTAHSPVPGLSETEREACIQHLANYGQATLVSTTGPTSHPWLVDSAVLDQLFAEFVSRAWRNRRGRGALDGVLMALLEQGIGDLPEEGRKVCLDHAEQLFGRRNLAYREGPYLIFPDLAGYRPPRVPDRSMNEISAYKVDGTDGRFFISLTTWLGYTHHGLERDPEQPGRHLYKILDTVCGIRPMDPAGTEQRVVVTARAEAALESIRAFERCLELYFMLHRLKWEKRPLRCPSCNGALDPDSVLIQEPDSGKYLWCEGCTSEVTVHRDDGGQCFLSIPKEVLKRTDKAFREAMAKVRHWKRKRQRPTCFISYAWDKSREADDWSKRDWTNGDNRWVWQFARDLESMSVSVEYDLWQDIPLISDFMAQTQKVDYVVVVGTHAYLEKSRRSSGVQKEMRMINQRLKDRPETVLPLLVQGTPATSLPKSLQKLWHADFRNTHQYHMKLFEVFVKLFQIPNKGKAVNEAWERLRVASRRGPQ